MDPDMVRQQEEAEQEAMKLAALKPPVPAAPAGAADEKASGIPAYGPVFFGSRPHEPAEDSLVLLSRVVAGDMPSPFLEAPSASPGAARRKRRYLIHAFEKIGRFISFGLAGGILGGGLGIFAANYLQLPPEEAKLVIFGGSGALAALCAIASLFDGG